MTSLCQYPWLKAAARWLELCPTIEGDANECAVHRAQGRAIYEGGKSSILANVVIAVAMTFVLWESAPKVALMVWLCFTSLVAACRHVLILNAMKYPERLERTDAVPLYVLGTLFLGLSWSIIPIFFFPNDITLQAFLAFCLSGIAAGASTILASIRGAMFAYIVPILLPLFLQFITSSGQVHTTMGVLTLCFFIFLTQSAAVSRDNFVRLIRTRLEKDRLTTDLENALDEVKKASAFKSSLMANVSHEIRTPMNAIVGMTEEALQHARSTEVVEYLETSLDAARWLLQIINDLLDISKIEAGKLTLTNEPFHLQNEINRIQRLLQQKFNENSLRAGIQVDPSVPQYVRGDALRYGQILLNLVGNAAKFTPPNGEIIVSVNITEQSNDSITIQTSISDTGIGIPIAQQAKIFEAFAQADSSITRRFGGTGLGLTISSELTRLMGGKIWLESSENSGSTFHFSIPFDTVSESLIKGNHDSVTPRTLPALSLLVVDDNTINQKVVGSILSRAGHSVTFASDGKEALKKISEADFSIIFMDCQMPIMDGLSTALEIRKREASLQLQPSRIIALTAYADDEDKVRCIECGMDAFLTKPIDRRVLIQTLQEQYAKFESQHLQEGYHSK